MKILMVETGGRGGMYSYTEALCGGLAANGADVTVLTSPAWPSHDYPFQVVRLLRSVEDKRFLCRLNWVVDRLTKVTWNTLTRNRFAVREGFDVVHIQSGTPLVDQYLLRPLQKRIPVVLTIHDVQQHASRLITRAGFNRRYFSIPDNLIVHYDDGKRQMADDWHIPAERTDVIPHGAMPLRNSLSREEARKHLSLPTSSAVVLFFGGIRPNKGLNILLDALPEVAKRIPDVLLVIAGRMPRGLTFDPYHEQIVRLNLESHVHTSVQFIPEEEVDVYFASSDIVVMPYLHFEAQSGILLRAYSHHKPVVVSNVGALGDQVEEDHVGSVVNPADPGGLAKAIVDVLSNRDDYRKSYTRQLEEKYSWKRIGAQTIGCYEKVIRNRCC